MRLDPHAHVGQTRVEAERGQRSHDDLEHFHAKERHEIARTTLGHAVDEHRCDESREDGDHERHRFVFGEISGLLKLLLLLLLLLLERTAS